MGFEQNYGCTYVKIETSNTCYEKMAQYSIYLKALAPHPFTKGFTENCKRGEIKDRG